MAREDREEIEKPARKLLLRRVDFDKPGRCRSCGASITWAMTRAGKSVPLDANARLVLQTLATGGYAVPATHVHFATCPQAAAHRRRPSEEID